MLSCSPPAHGRGISRMPGSAERVGSPAPQVTDRATENGTRCPTGPGVDSLHPCPSRRPAPHRVPSKTHNPPRPSVITAQAGISQLSRAASAASDPSLRWGDDLRQRDHRSRGRTMLAQRRGDRRGVASAVSVRSLTPVGYKAERCVARTTSAPSAPLRANPLSFLTKKTFRPPPPDNDVPSTSSTSARAPGDIPPPAP